MTRRPIPALAALVVAVALAGCGGGGTPGTPGPGGGPRQLTVSAAASLGGAFGMLEQRFEQANPGVEVVLNYGGSSSLAQQIVNGAPVDVFAAASTSTMDMVVTADLVAGVPAPFVTNKLEIAVAPGNPRGIAGFADLARPGLKVVVCAPQVPCGAAKEKIEQVTGVRLTPVSEESEVTSVLGKVGTGDADAGVVYMTDVRSAPGTVTGVPFKEAEQAVNTYPIAVLKPAREPALAAAWVDLVRGPGGQAVLREAGFGPP